MVVFTNLKSVKYFLAFLGSAVLIFDVSYYFMSVLPGSRDMMCIEGANLTPANIAFSLILSLLIGVMIAGFIALFAKNYAKQKAALTSLSGFAFLVGTMSVMCVSCTIPVISLFGFSVWLDFISNNEFLFKVVSLCSIGAALFLLNKQLKGECKVCVEE